MLPKEESCGMKNPKLDLLADSRADLWPEVMWPSPTTGCELAAAGGRGSIPREGVVPALSNFFCRSRSSRIFRC